MVSVSKSTGAGGSLWPAGLTMETISDEYISVVSHTLSILGWHENMPSEDIPDPWKWCLPWELEKHWELVRGRRGSPRGAQESYNEEPENLLFEDWEKELRSPY